MSLLIWIESIIIKKEIKENGVSVLFYIGFGLQLIGFASVGLCLFAGMSKGDYGQLELIQLVGGSLVFYLGQFLRGKSQN